MHLLFYIACFCLLGISSTLSSHHPSTITTTTTVASNSFLGSGYRPSADYPFLDSNKNFTVDQTIRGVLKYPGVDAGLIIPYDENAEFVDIPGKGQVQVFVAKYTYDPLIHSPNENPEAELNVNAGDYIVVYGDMDEVTGCTSSSLYLGEVGVGWVDSTD